MADNVYERMKNEEQGCNDTRRCEREGRRLVQYIDVDCCKRLAKSLRGAVLIFTDRVQGSIKEGELSRSLRSG